MKKIKWPIIIFFFFLIALIVRIVTYEGFVPFGDRGRYWDHTHLTKDQWKDIRGVSYRFDKDGHLQNGWLEEDGKTMYLKSGLPVRGAAQIDGKEYYFDEKAAMKTGMIEVDGHWRFYDDDGPRRTGWITYEGETYFMGKKDRTTGWMEDKGRRYYFDREGRMVTGWFVLGGNRYLFDKKGALITNKWHQEDANTYFLAGDGHAVSGKVKIKGQIYLFSDDCLLLRNQWLGNSYADEDGKMVRNTNIHGLPVDARGERVFHGDYGDAGCLLIPDTGVQVPLYENEGDDEGQVITDRQNSAVYFTSFRMPVIADHNNQGFEKIKGCIPDVTYAFVLTKNRVNEYQCTKICNGTNTLEDILDDRGVSVDYSGADLCLYTCNEDWRHVTVVFFDEK